MPTGDGLLARLATQTAVPLGAWRDLCAAADRYGNGIMEVSQRGNLQFRGLSTGSAPAFAAALEAIGLAGEIRPSLHAPPLLGLEDTARPDLSRLVSSLRRALAVRDATRPLHPKLSIVVDGDGKLHLDGIAADVRLRMRDDSRVHVALAGDAAASASLGWTEPDQAIDVVMHILATLAAAGPGARARQLFEENAQHALRASLAHLLSAGPPPLARPPAQPIGTHALRDDRMALGIAPAFGHASAAQLARLGEAAARSGALSIQPAPGRALLVIGLGGDAAAALAASLGGDGFIVVPSDVRRSVIACAGAPACGAASLDTRRLAPAVARAAGSWLDGSVTIHLSGCSKGCAHPGVADLTLVGPDRLIVRGRAGDAVQGRIAPPALLGGLEGLAAPGRGGSAERASDLLARWGAAGLLEALGAATFHE